MAGYPLLPGAVRNNRAIMSLVSIRPAVPADVPQIHRFITDLAVYEKAPEQVHATEAQLQATLFGPGATAHALMCEQGGLPIGYAVYFFNYSTWQGRPGLYLEDLFVRPAYRGRGIGKALLVHLAQIAVRENCGRLVWQVLDWNEPSIKFYESLGAQAMKEWITMRVTGEALARLARQSL